jgi:2-C-methyl-D-erythritol 2,4-cyclodiphosphate synthase
MIRIGHGYDVHALVDDRDLILGGIKIDWPKGLDGHSDADVLIHAICDALLGAAGCGDIGRHFPPSEDRFKNIDSRILLRETIGILSEKNWKVSNIDATIIAEKPKLATYIPNMITLLAEDMKIDVSAINIKATTTEKLGFVGREEGIAAEAVALIESA